MDLVPVAEFCYLRAMRLLFGVWLCAMLIVHLPSDSRQPPPNRAIHAIYFVIIVSVSIEPNTTRHTMPSGNIYRMEMRQAARYKQLGDHCVNVSSQARPPSRGTVRTDAVYELFIKWLCLS